MHKRKLVLLQKSRRDIRHSINPLRTAQVDCLFTSLAGFAVSISSPPKILPKGVLREVDDVVRSFQKEAGKS